MSDTRILQTGETAPVRPWDTAPTPLQLALARRHRWLAMLNSGEVKSLREIAAREGVDSSYVSRIVNLTTLAPDIVAAILDEPLHNHITLFDLAVDPPALWEEQSGGWWCLRLTAAKRKGDQLCRPTWRRGKVGCRRINSAGPSNCGD